MDTNPTTPTDVLLLRIPEAAHRLGIGRTKAYELIADGRLEVVRIDGAVRVPAAALEAFVEECRTSRSVGHVRYGAGVAGGRPTHRFR